MLRRVLLFIVLNFIALAIGGIVTGPGVTSEWYTSLNQAPWTPPGWVFGAAWTFIMICFALFMAYWWESAEHKKGVAILFGIQWVLNIIWNPIFFHFQEVLTGLLVIFSLTVLVWNFFFLNRKTLEVKSYLIAPYMIWLAIATSLNAYIYLYN